MQSKGHQGKPMGARISVRRSYLSLHQYFIQTKFFVRIHATSVTCHLYNFELLTKIETKEYEHNCTVLLL